MKNGQLSRVLVATAATLLMASGAAAQSSHAAPQAKANAAPEAQNAGAKAKGDDKATTAKTDDKGGKDAVDPSVKTAERAARVATQHEAQRDQLRAMLKGPMPDALKQELRVHAERVAKLERIKMLADKAKDKDASDRAAKALEKEATRDQKFMTGMNATAAATPTPMPNAAAPMAPNANPNSAAAPNAAPNSANAKTDKAGAQ